MVQYKKFKIGASYIVRGNEVLNDSNGLFVIKPTKRRINAKDAKVHGPFNYVSRGTTENGISSHIQYDSQYLNDANTLSFAQDTAAIFYQDKPYFTGNKVNVFALNKKYGKLTRETGLYLCGSIRLAFPNFKWGTLLNIEKIANTDIMLPVTPDGDPDFAYMTEYIRELEKDRIRELEAYLEITGLDDTKLSASEAQALTKQVRWKRFKIGELFNVPGKGDVDLQNDDVNGEGEFFINSGSTNYGIKGRTSRKAKVFPKNTITIDFFGNAYYRDFPYKLATHNHVFSFESDLIKSREVGLYIVGALSYLKNKFSYHNMMTWNKLKKLDVQLPVTPDSSIDFAYMQDYIRATEKQVIKDVVAYKDRVIEETKRVVNG